MTSDQLLTIYIDGQAVELGLMPAEPLVRAVIVSLFTWRRANPDDELPGSDLQGWWGDTYAPVAGDRIGSRLWLLWRTTVTPEVMRRAKEYATEALQWLLDDGVATSVQVDVARLGLHGLVLTCVVTRADTGQAVSLRFNDVWGFLNAN